MSALSIQQPNAERPEVRDQRAEVSKQQKTVSGEQ
jgi:hypothetical protein